MSDTQVIAEQLEAEALANGWPRNHQRIDFTTAQGNPAMALVTVTVQVPAIVENDDAFSVAFQQTTSLDVLANDTDPIIGDNSTLIVGSVTQPPAGQGSVAISADSKTVTYTPPAGFVGQAQFTYSAARTT